MKRVVTGINGQGRSCIVSVEELDASTPEGSVVWEYRPDDVLASIRAIDPDGAAAMIEPEALGGARWYFGTFAPDAEREAFQIPNMDEDGFHTTRTIDFDYIVDGELVLVLDEDRITVEKGDFVIQQATRHAWRNESAAPAVILGLLHRPTVT